MLSIMKKALHLEESETTVNYVERKPSGTKCSSSERMENNDERVKAVQSRSDSPVSMYRYGHFDSDEESDADLNSSVLKVPSVSRKYTVENRLFQSTGTPFDADAANFDHRDESNEEHDPLSYYSRPMDTSGDWRIKIKREIEAARKAAGLSVIVDRAYINKCFSLRDERETLIFNRLKEQLTSPSARIKLRPIRSPDFEEVDMDVGHANFVLDSKKSSLFVYNHFVLENDDIGEGVSVQTNLLNYEDDRRKVSALRILPRRSSSITEVHLERKRIEYESPNDSNVSTTENRLSLHQSIKSIDKMDESSRSKIRNQNCGSLIVPKQRLPAPFNADNTTSNEVPNCLSATESDVGSVDGLPTSLQSKWLMGASPKEQMLASLDGIQSLAKASSAVDSHRISSPLPMPEPILAKYSTETLDEAEKMEDYQTIYDVWPFNFVLCGRDFGTTSSDDKDHKNTWKEHTNVPLALMDCANIIYQEDRIPVTAPAVPTSLVRVASDPAPLSYAETLLSVRVDPRMQDWISSRFKTPGKPPKDGSYNLGKSRTVIVHEIARGAWTWCTEWSPDGSMLAVATENHRLAVIDTTSSTVWRVRHDRKIKGPMKINTTHSIRAIAWGHQFIAIGGTGDAVSILAPTQPYPVLHTVTGTGFVGTLDWKGKSNVLAFGSRLDKVTIIRVSSTDEDSVIHGWKQTVATKLHTIELKHWANSVKFCSGGGQLAVGDAGGVISVYTINKLPKGKLEAVLIALFPRKDSILCVEWSPDSKWLYAGGEDRCVTVIDCAFWEIVHKNGRERWVQCISCSQSGSHLAVGGVSSEISLLDTNNGWDSVMGIELKGLVPLSANWHPKDQYLALTGQSNSILVVETTNARHVKGHHLYSISPIVAVEFSPDGRMAIIANQAGVVTFFSLSGTTFIVAYELIVSLNRRISVRWSLNGTFAVIGGKEAVTIVGHKKSKRQGKKAPPNVSSFSVRKVLRDFGETHAVSIDFRSHYVAVSGNSTRILDVRSDFSTVREWNNGPFYANAWSPDGRWFAMIGEAKLLTIYDTSEERVTQWRPIFSMKCDFVGLSLAWGPLIIGGLLYLAYGGTSNEIFIMEIRTREGTWETVLRIPRDGSINALDWSTDGLLAAAIGNGTVGIIDLGYLQTGVAVNEMDYNWQRQALTCFTEIRRNRGRNSMQCIRWLPAAPGSDRLLAVGGTDGELEILDLTERKRCRGYVQGS